MRPCGKADVTENLFPPHNDDFNRPMLETLAPNAYCIDDPSAALLRGQWSSEDGLFLSVRWLDCTDDAKCKRPEEIDQFKQEARLTHLHNSQVYEPTEYSPDVIYNSSRIESFNFDGQRNIYQVTKSTLTDQRNVYSIGFFS